MNRLRSAARQAHWMPLALSAFAAILALGLPAGKAGAQATARPLAGSPPPIEELFVGAVPFTQERGEIQFGSLLHGRRIAGRRAVDLSFEVEYGLADWLELSIESTGLQYARGEWSQGFSRGAGVTATIARDGPLPRMRLGLSATTEFEREDDRESRFSGSGAVLGSWGTPTRLPLHAFVVVPLALSHCEAPDDFDDGESECLAGAMLSVGRARLTAELPFDQRNESGARLMVIGLSMLTHATQIGIATSASMRGAPFLAGVRLVLVRDF